MPRVRSLPVNEIDAINLSPGWVSRDGRFEARAKVVRAITAEGSRLWSQPDDPRSVSSGRPREPLNTEIPDQAGG